MTDCSSKIVSWWKDRPFFQPYLAEGIVEFYTFDMLNTMGTMDAMDAMDAMDSRNEVKLRRKLNDCLDPIPLINNSASRYSVQSSIELSSSRCNIHFP